MKFSELPAASTTSTTDVVAILQNNVSKKATIQQLLANVEDYTAPVIFSATAPTNTEALWVDTSN